VHRSEFFNTYGGDISLHGHYAFANLFEGNIVQNIIIDHAWGPSGPYNTFFRNRAENYGIIFTNGDPTFTDSQHIIGNDVIYNGLFFVGGPYDITGTGHIEHGNNIDGTIEPPGTDTLTDTSYYLTAEPQFWNIDDTWPSLGIPNLLGAGTNPARERYLDQDYTVCPLRREWTGLVSANWNNPHNWEPYGIPDEATVVTVPNTPTYDPQISTGMTHYIRSLYMQQNAGINISGSSTLIVVK
jgi:hypothetical protein